jgi:putative transposase
MKGTFLLGAGRGCFRYLSPQEEWSKEMIETFQYRLYPTKKQQTLLNAWLALCCEIYNAALRERRDAYRMAGVSISYSQQCAELPGCKDVRPELCEVNSQVLQDALKRVDRAFESFYRRCAAGDKSGYPRFRSRLRYDSLTFKQYGNSFSLHRGTNLQGKLILSKLGHLKMVMHRPIKGLPKTATVKRTPAGKWFVSISVESDGVSIPSPPSEEQVGVDVGLKTFAYLSTGEQIDNPRFFREEEHALARAQRTLSKEQKGTSERERRRKVVARVHERVRWRRENFIRQQVAWLIKRFGLIAVEALVVRNLVKNPNLAKSIADAAWSSFFAHLLSKAAEAGREVVRVNPAYTSQTCSACGQRQAMPLSVRVYECTTCGLVIDRDYNGSKNILAEALEAMGRHGCVIPEAPGS